jgi:hypothetical protein
MALAIKKLPHARPKGISDSKKIVAEETSNELVFAIVGHVGSGNTTVATALQDVLQGHKINTIPFKVAIIKARTVIDEGMAKLGAPIPTATGKLLSEVQGYQNAGDKLREQDHAAVARGAVSHSRHCERSEAIHFTA